MLDELRGFLEEEIVRHGAIRVVLAPYVVFLALIGFGALQEGSTLLLVSTLAVSATSATILMALVLEIRDARRALGRRGKIIDGLTRSLLDTESGPPYYFKEYDMAIFVRDDGDAMIEEWFTGAVPAESGPLRVLWTGHEQGPPEIRDRDRRRIDVEARSFGILTDGSRTIGPRHMSITQWEGNGARVYSYFDPPLEPGTDLRLYLRWRWPGYYRELLSGGQDGLFWLQRRSTLSRAHGRLLFDGSCRLPKQLAIRPSGHPNTILRQVRNADGSVEIEVAFEADPGGALPPRVGVDLEYPQSYP